jgi:hypothetical protein
MFLSGKRVNAKTKICRSFAVIVCLRLSANVRGALAAAGVATCPAAHRAASRSEWEPDSKDGNQSNIAGDNGRRPYSPGHTRIKINLTIHPTPQAPSFTDARERNTSPAPLGALGMRYQPSSEPRTSELDSSRLFPVGFGLPYFAQK